MLDHSRVPAATLLLPTARLTKICTLFRAHDLAPIGNFSYTDRQLSGQGAMLKDLRREMSDLKEALADVLLENRHR